MRFHGESAVNFEPIASIFRKMTSANCPDPGQSEVSGRNGKQRRERRTETGSLKDEGNQPFHAPLIRSVLVGKLLEHEFFLVAQFDPNAREY